MSATAEQVRTFAVSDEDDGIRLDRWFKRNLPDVSFGQVSRWARTGQLRVDGKRATPGDRIAAGQSIRVPPQGEEAPPAPAKTKAPDRPKLSADEIEFVRALVIHEDAAAIVVNKPPGPRHPGRHQDERASRPAARRPASRTARRGRSWSTGSTRTRRARCWSRARRAPPPSSRRASRAAPRARSIGRSSSDVPSIDDGMIDLPLAKQPGTGGEKMHVDEKEGVALAHPLPRDRAGRQPRRLGRAAAAHRPHPPAARPHARDRPPDRRRRQIWRARTPS